MGRLKRFEQHRLIGTRDDMVLYDCDDDEMMAKLQTRIEEDDLQRLNLLQSFAPDTEAEASNRGFHFQ